MAMKALCGLSAVLFSVALAKKELQVTSDFKPSGCDKAQKARRGQAAALIVTGWIEESNVKFTEYSEGRKMETVLGKDAALKGLHKGVEGMCIGEKRTIVVPPELAHGGKEYRAEQGTTIPANSALRFKVELAALGSQMWYEHGKPVNIFKRMDTDVDGKLTAAEFTAWFKKQGKVPPVDLFEKQDKDGDGFIALAEFSGPKGELQQ
jgi:hypothetical protein